MTSFRGDRGGAPSAGGAASSSSSSSSSGTSSASAPRGEQLCHQHRQQRPQHRHQVNAAVEVTPGDDDARAAGRVGGGGDGRDDGGHEDDYDMVDGSASAREAAAAAEGRALGSDRDMGRTDGQGQDSQHESGGAHRPLSSRTPHLRRCLSLVGLEDLPDRVLARVLFSGFLNSLDVASTLRHISKRVMMVASTACKVRCGWGGMHVPSVAKQW